MFRQTLRDWELILIDDGSTDETSKILKEHRGCENIKIISQKNKGLTATNNIALRISNSKYIMRLDADDYLDENALLVLSSTLDAKPQVGLVYPDYYLVDEQGEILEVVRRKKIGQEVELLDLPAHGACTMFRKECLLELGGYSERFRFQDGYELWIRFIESFNPYNVNVPLFYYRQHHSNLTKNKDRILRTQAEIKRQFVKHRKNNKIPRVLAVVPVVKRPKYSPDDPFNLLAGKPLIWYTLSEASKSKMLDKIVVTTDDKAVFNYCRNFNKIVALSRPEHLARSSSKVGSTLLYLLDTFKNNDGYAPDAVMVLYINTPLRRCFHIEKSIDTMAIFGVDSVISVNEEVDHFYQHHKYGLTAINKRKGISLEREALYKGNGAITLTRSALITDGEILGKSIGHIAMLPEEGIRIRNNFEFWMAGKILTEWRNK